MIYTWFFIIALVIGGELTDTALMLHPSEEVCEEAQDLYLESVSDIEDNIEMQFGESAEIEVSDCFRLDIPKEGGVEI